MKTEVHFASPYVTFTVLVKDDATDAARLKALIFVRRWIDLVLEDMEPAKMAGAVGQLTGTPT